MCVRDIDFASFYDCCISELFRKYRIISFSFFMCIDFASIFKFIDYILQLFRRCVIFCFSLSDSRKVKIYIWYIVNTGCFSDARKRWWIRYLISAMYVFSNQENVRLNQRYFTIKRKESLLWEISQLNKEEAARWDDLCLIYNISQLCNHSEVKYIREMTWYINNIQNEEKSLHFRT